MDNHLTCIVASRESDSHVIVNGSNIICGNIHSRDKGRVSSDLSRDSFSDKYTSDKQRSLTAAMLLGLTTSILTPSNEDKYAFPFLSLKYVLPLVGLYPTMLWMYFGCSAKYAFINSSKELSKELSVSTRLTYPKSSLVLADPTR